MSTVFPDAEAVAALDVELLEQPTAPAVATAAIATAASAGVSLLPFKVRILSLTWTSPSPGRGEIRERQSGMKYKPDAAM